MRVSTHVADHRGFALVTIVFVLLMLAGLTPVAYKMSQAAIKTSRNHRSATQALYAAEAGVAHAIMLINQVGVINLTNDVITQWPGAGAPFPTNPNPMPNQANFAYQASIAPDPCCADPNRAVLTSTGTGSDNSLRTVRARVVRSGVPNAPPGALYLASDAPTDATFTGNAFVLDGNDACYGTPGPKPAVPGITARTEANAQETRDSLNSMQKDNVKGLGYIDNPITPSVAAGTGPSAAQISQMIADLLALPHVTYGNHNITGTTTLGTEAAPQITYFNNAGGTVIKATGNASGVGILIVEQALTIQGDLDFQGLILVRGTTEVTDVTGHATVHGSLWTTDFNLTVGGSALVQYCSQALALANQSGGGGPGTLPAPVVITAWRDVF